MIILNLNIYINDYIVYCMVIYVIGFFEIDKYLFKEI